ncbi:MAG: cytochrome c [Bauldia sp.]|nr:cytochrome c [Bauldia sp.]
MVLAIGVSALAWYLSRPAKDDLSNGPSVAVRLPASFSGRAIRGKVHFDENCAACHGENAAGTGNGPPLVHNIYEPGHHADAAFQLAATRGTRSHHWNFGDMPPVAGIEAEEVSFIVAYVRELQRANGIE